MSVLLDNGTLVSWRGDASIDDVADFGPDAIRSIALQALTRSRQGEPLLWDEQIRDENPESGVHVDYQTQTLRWWSLIDDNTRIEGFVRFWPGWTIEPMGDNYEQHQLILGRQMRRWTDDVAEAREQLGRLIAEGMRKNPLLAMAERLSAAGQEIQANAAALQFIPSGRTAARDIVMNHLERLATEDPLPPARFIDRSGSIHTPRSPGDQPRHRI